MRLLFKYAKANWLFVSVGIYALLACVLKIITAIDITIPCIFKLLFHITCPGCGLTHAFIDLLQLDIVGAWNHNSLIFLVIPLGSFLILSHFLKFRKMYFTQKLSTFKQ